jgi:hypothetical protein
VVILTAITASLSLRLSEQFGRLSIPPTYDDVAYFLAAAQWLNAAPSQGLAANLYGLLHQHAPFSTLTAVIGFTLRPDGYLGPYAINAVIILAFLLGLAVLLAAISRRYRDLPGRRCVRADVVADHDGSTSRPAMGSRTGIGHRGRSSSTVAATQPLVNLSPRRAVRSCLRDQAPSFSRVLRMRWIGGRRPTSVRMPIFGIELVRLSGYIVSAMIHNRDFWTVNESRTSLIHCQSTSKATALNYWLWVV